MANKSGNKGEWSEIYTFIKLLTEGRIYAADKNLNKMSKDMYFPIIKIRREEVKGNTHDYHVGEKIKIFHNELLIKEIDSQEFYKQSEYLYKEIFYKDKGNLKLEEMTGFKIFLDEIFVSKIKAGSGEKADIIMEIIDINTGYKPMVGFSVKSQLGSAPTLMNASNATNFVFKVLGIDDAIMNEVNEIETKTKIIDRFKLLYEKADKIEFFNTKKIVFRDNLELIDSKMPEILSHVMEYRYRENVKKYDEIVNLLCERNPLNYNNNKIYIYKAKKLLCAFALGMLPDTRWDGIDQANGGYIIVKSDGEVVAYYIYNRNDFEEYLYRTTYLESGSTKKHGFAVVYKENNEYFVNMNAQIRFKA